MTDIEKYRIIITECCETMFNDFKESIKDEHDTTQKFYEFTHELVKYAADKRAKAAQPLIIKRMGKK